MGWVKIADRLPEKAGAYRVKRRGRPAYEDECQYSPPREIRPGCFVGAQWQSRRGVVITSVVEWMEEEDI